FHRCRTARVVTTDSPTRAATWAGVRGSSVRSNNQRACHRTFSTGWPHARYLARAWLAVRWRTTGSRCIGFPPTELHGHGRESAGFGITQWDSPPRRPIRVYEDGAVRDAWRTLPAARLITRFRHLFPVPPDATTEFHADAKPPRNTNDPLDPGGFLSGWQFARQRQIARLRERAARDADGWAGSGSAFAPGPVNAETFERQCC